MRWIIAVLFCASLVEAQDATSAHRVKRDGSGATRSLYRQQGTNALAKEQARSKANLCTDAEKGGNARIAQCLTDQAKETEKNYIAYIRAVGALLRLTSGPESAQSSQKRLAFDFAEESWQTYRDRSCTSMATQWEGGDQAPVSYSDCRLKVTWNHMNELADLYSDLWH
jgi:uncharacterized protein YecT (DUF1311 family)